MFNSSKYNINYNCLQNKNFVVGSSGRLKRRKRLGVFRKIFFKVNPSIITDNSTSNRFFILNKDFLLRVRNKFGRFFLKKDIRAHRRFLKRLNRNFFHFFLKKIGLHKHRFFLNKYFSKYQKFWNYVKKRNKFLRLQPVNRVPRFILKSYSSNFVNRTFNILLESSLSIRNFSLAESNCSFNNLAIAKLLKKKDARLFLLQNPLSGHRFLKYVVLFSKRGNQKNLFNLVLKNFLISRFIFCKNIIKYFYHFGTITGNNNPFLKPNSFTKSNYLEIKFSLLCRRLYFSQTSSFPFYSNSNNRGVLSISVKFSKLFNSNLFLTSIRLLNQLLSTFRVYVEIKPWKKSGRSIIVPAPIKSQTRRSFIFSHWFKESVLSKSKIGDNFGLQVFKEFKDLSRLEGDSIKKLNSLSKIIQTNKAFIRKSNMRIV